MRLLFLGDVVGRSGRQAVIEELPRLRARYQLDFVAINGENAAGGFGITEAILEERSAPAPMWSRSATTRSTRKEALVFIERQERLLRPITSRPARPGKVWACSRPRMAPTCVINAMGLIFMPTRLPLPGGGPS
jgi:calcineurin-like phosphoesterase